MVISITSPSTANITDTQSSVSVTVSGKANPGNIVAVSLRINGITVASNSGTGTTVSISFNTTVRSNIYTNAEGSSLSGCVSIFASEYTSEGEFISSTSKTGGTLTIAARLTSLSVSTANPYNLDSITDILMSWTRPHSAFRGRIYVKVNGVTCISRSGFNTAPSFTPDAGEITAMENAMGGTSPGSIQFIAETGFVASSTVYYTSGALSLTRSSGIVKSFYAGSRVYLKVAGTYQPHLSYAKIAGTWKLAQVYGKVAGVWKESL